MSSLKQELLNLCLHPLPKQPEFKYLGHVNLITNLVINLINNHRDDIIENFSDWEMRTQKKDSNKNEVQISEVNITPFQMTFPDDQLKIGYQCLTVDAKVVFVVENLNRIFCHFECIFKNTKGNQVDSLPLASVENRDQDFEKMIKMINSIIVPLGFYLQGDHVIHLMATDFRYMHVYMFSLAVE